MTQIIQKNLLEQYREDTTAYAIYISRMRVTPSPKDGFKPIHRRIIYTGTFMCPTDKLTKSSSIVGRCMDSMHPHGSYMSPL
ncbi:MAG: DNA gyrase subunit A [Paraclostridium sp.]